MAPDRRRRRRAGTGRDVPSRARTRSRRPARTLLLTAAIVVAGTAAGLGLAAADVAPEGVPVFGAQPSAPPSPTPSTPAASASPVGPITAPMSASVTPGLTPAPVVSVGPGVDKDLHSLDDPASPWVVVNKSRAISPERWAPADLDSAGGAPLVPAASQALAEMREAAADAGVPLSVGTGYRAFGFQEYLYSDYVSRWGRERADRFSARAGHSEHQTGLAADVYASVSCRLKECFADEPAGRWVAEHGHEFGFLVRYPAGSEHITGYKHEPWHVRYVGVDLATAMHEHDIATLEEFFSLPAAPEYD